MDVNNIVTNIPVVSDEQLNLKLQVQLRLVSNEISACWHLTFDCQPQTVGPSGHSAVSAFHQWVAGAAGGDGLHLQLFLMHGYFEFCSRITF